MKKILIVIGISMLLQMPANACDICGCGVGNNYIGILPDFYKKILGIRYRYSSLLTHVGSNGILTYLTTKEQYRTTELWGGWNIGEKFRVMANVPFNFNTKENQGVAKNKNGLGDINISSFYQLLNSRKTIFSNRLLVQNLWVGGSIKLPTGQYNPLDKTGNNDNVNLFQLGTGSANFFLSMVYDIRLQNFGLNVSGSYNMNTVNRYNYSYGNKFNISTQAYYKLYIKDKVTIAPNTGILYETTQKDTDNKVLVDISGGSLLVGTVGIETTVGKVSIGGNWQTPFSQNLAHQLVKANSKMMLHISFSL